MVSCDWSSDVCSSDLYACRSPRLYSLNWTCRKLARSLDFSIAHVPRESNSEANSLAHHAVRTQADPRAW